MELKSELPAEIKNNCANFKARLDEIEKGSGK